MRLRERGTDAEKDEEIDIDGGTPQVNGPAAEPRCQQPLACIDNEAEARIDQTELEGEVFVDVGLCKHCQCQVSKLQPDLSKILTPEEKDSLVARWRPIDKPLGWT